MAGGVLGIFVDEGIESCELAMVNGEYLAGQLKYLTIHNCPFTKKGSQNCEPFFIFYYPPILEIIFHSQLRLPA